MFRALQHYKNIVVILSLILLSMGMMVTSVNEGQGGAVVTIISYPFMPLISALSRVGAAVNDAWDGVVGLWRVQEENKRIRAELKSLQSRVNQLEEYRQANLRLSHLLSFQERSEFDLIPTRVIGRDTTNWFNSIVVDKGASDGVEVNMAVVTDAGVVGKVVQTVPRASKVMLITDSNSKLGVIVQSNRFNGILTGKSGEYCELTLLSENGSVAVGDVIVTSGYGGIFPKGLIVGSVVEVKRRTGLVATAKVLPSEDFTRLEEVFIVKNDHMKDVKRLIDSR
ncbi:MAG: rod shape-determining protein MreC [bacterium]